MKKLSIIALLICALCMCTVAVSAEITVTPEMVNDEVVSVEVTGTANANDKVTVLAIEGIMDETGTAMLQQYTEDDLDALLINVTYIDQKTASDNAASFSFVPRDFDIADHKISVYASDGSTTAVNSVNINDVEYTVTLMSKDETYNTVTVIKGTNLLEALSAVTAPKETFGSDFVKWTKAGGEEIAADETVTADITLYAKWEPRFSSVTIDTGYCTTGEGEEAVETGVISILAQPTSQTISGWRGVYVWRGNNFSGGVGGSSAFREISAAAGQAIFSVITDIPQASYQEGVVIVPWLNVGGSIMRGNPQVVKLEGELKNLGDLDALKAEIQAAYDVQNPPKG